MELSVFVRGSLAEGLGEPSAFVTASVIAQHPKSQLLLTVSLLRPPAIFSTAFGSSPV
jgi:hypothetical protein